MSFRAVLESECRTAQCRAVIPSDCGAFTSAPLSSNDWTAAASFASTASAIGAVTPASDRPHNAAATISPIRNRTDDAMDSPAFGLDGETLEQLIHLAVAVRERLQPHADL